MDSVHLDMISGLDLALASELAFLLLDLVLGIISRLELEIRSGIHSQCNLIEQICFMEIQDG